MPRSLHPTGRVRRATPDERGSASLELVIVFPVLMLLFFAAIQAGVYFYGRSVALAAAQEGARAAAQETGSAGKGQAAAAGFADRAGGRLIQSLSISSRRGGQTAAVAVRGRSLSLLPGFDGFAIEQVAALPVEKVSG